MTGLCECGCGRVTTVSPKTSARAGIVKGEHRRFIKGHHVRLMEYTPEMRAKQREAKLGERNPNWNDSTSLKTVHGWLNRNFPKTGICARCGRGARTDFAFRLHPATYTRSRDDYEEMCRSCHVKHDLAIGVRRKRNGRFVTQTEGGE